MTIMEEKTIDSSDVATLVRRAAEGDRKAIFQYLFLLAVLSAMCGIKVPLGTGR